LAFPLFVVVVGVDPRWIKNALIKKYHLQFGNNEGDLGLEKINASNYLEKIFQVPFQLETASDENVKNMIRNLAKVNGTKSFAQEKLEESLRGGNLKKAHSLILI
jgi:hypothetical protein